MSKDRYIKVRLSKSWAGLISLLIAACGGAKRYTGLVDPPGPLDNGHADYLYFGPDNKYPTLKGPKNDAFKIDVPLTLCAGDAMLLRFSPHKGGVEVMQAAVSCPSSTTAEIEGETSDQFSAILKLQKQALVEGLGSAGFVVEAEEIYSGGAVHARFRRNEWYGEIYFVVGRRWRAYYAIMQRAEIAGQPKCWDTRAKNTPHFSAPSSHGPTQFPADC